MQRMLCSILLGLSLLVGWTGPVTAASEQAMQLRKDGALSEYSPSEAFLSGNFIADEIEPTFIFGKIRDFARSRSCPTTWLMEEAEKQRVEARENRSAPFESTLILEEDCPGKVMHYVFVDQSQSSLAQWMEWRKQFHKSKAEREYGAVQAGLERAAQNGFPVTGELRFIQINGDIQLKKAEEVVKYDLNFQPCYDLKQGKPFVP